MYACILCLLILMQMPHELTVEPSTGTEAELIPTMSRSRILNTDQLNEVTAGHAALSRQESAVPHMFAETPKKITHHHDEDNDSDNESSETSTSDQPSN